MVVPLIPLLIGGGIAAKYAGSLYSGHYARKSLYNQKEMYDVQIAQYQKAKSQYQRNVGRSIKQPFDYDYNISQLRKGKQNLDYAVKSSWGNTVSGLGSATSQGAAFTGRIGGSSGYDTSGLYRASRNSLYNIQGGKKWL